MNKTSILLFYQIFNIFRQLIVQFIFINSLLSSSTIIFLLYGAFVIEREETTLYEI
jgi:hypothetical protein